MAKGQEAPAQVPPEKIPEPARRAPKRVTVMIPSDNTPTGSEAIVIGVNGHVINIPRDKKCSIPATHFMVLETARQDVVVKTTADGNPIFRSVPRYTYQVIQDKQQG